jgi:hypothetical protein
MIATIQEVGCLTGTVTRICGTDIAVNVELQDSDGTIYSCATTPALGHELAHHLFDGQVRVHGLGKWRRDPDQGWELESFTVQRWERLSTTTLPNQVSALRAIRGSLWNEFANPQLELKKLRAS